MSFALQVESRVYPVVGGTSYFSRFLLDHSYIRSPQGCDMVGKETKFARAWFLNLMVIDSVLHHSSGEMIERYEGK